MPVSQKGKMNRIAIVVLVTLTANVSYAQYTVEILPTPNGGGRVAGAGGGQIVGSAFGSSGGPALWNAPAYSYTNMMPSAFNAAELLGVGGGKQVGYARVTDGRDHALIWSGSANEYVDIDVPSFATGTAAWATDGISQVGVGGYEQNRGHALLWYGTAKSVVDLHPQGYVHSHAYGVWGDVQIGNVADFSLPGGAVMWRGTAESMTFLPIPKGYQGGFVHAVHGAEIVGSATVDGNGHAIIWNVDGIGFTDLTLKNWGGVALDSNGTKQVGIAAQAGIGIEQAVVWEGTAASMISLHQFLPAGFNSSRAFGIDEDGTIAGYGELAGFGSVPLVWTPVPEPATVTILGVGMLALCFGRHFRRS